MASAVQKVRASFYAAKFTGRLTSNGSRYDPRKMTCAHMTYPLGSRLLVTNPRTGRAVIVTVNDRGPWHTRFSLDLSEAAAQALGITKARGWDWVEIRRIDNEKLSNKRTPSKTTRPR